MPQFCKFWAFFLQELSDTQFLLQLLQIYQKIGDCENQQALKLYQIEQKSLRLEPGKSSVNFEALPKNSFFQHQLWGVRYHSGRSHNFVWAGVWATDYTELLQFTANRIHFIFREFHPLWIFLQRNELENIFATVEGPHKLLRLHLGRAGNRNDLFGLHFFHRSDDRLRLLKTDGNLPINHHQIFQLRGIRGQEVQSSL